MSKENFKLRKFKLKDKQDVEVEFVMNGKTISEKFTEPIHPDLLNKFENLKVAFGTITGLIPEENPSVNEIEMRGVFISDKGEFTHMILSAVVKYEIGYKANALTPKVPVDDYIEISSDKDFEGNLNLMIDEVYKLVYEGKTAQLKMDFEEKPE